MTNRMKILGIILLIGISISLYYSLKYYLKPTVGIIDLSKNKPFVDYVGKEFELKRNTFLGERKDEKGNYKTYIMDKEKDNLISKWYVLPKGTKMRITGAEIDKRPYDSGSAYIIGDVFLAELDKNVPFFYFWGSGRSDTSNPEVLDVYLVYELAPWQEFALEGKYPFDPSDSY